MRLVTLAVIRVAVSLAIAIAAYVALAYVGAGPGGALDVRFKLTERGLGIDKMTEALFLSTLFVPLIRSWWLAGWRERVSDGI